MAPLVISLLLFISSFPFLSACGKKSLFRLRFSFAFARKFENFVSAPNLNFELFFVPESRGTDSSGEDDSDEDDQNGNANDEVIAGSQSFASGAASFVRANIVRKSIFVFSY